MHKNVEKVWTVQFIFIYAPYGLDKGIAFVFVALFVFQVYNFPCSDALNNKVAFDESLHVDSAVTLLK